MSQLLTVARPEGTLRLDPASRDTRLALHEEKVHMPRLIPAVFVLGLVSLCLAGSDRLAGAPAQAAVQRPPIQRSPAADTTVYPPVFFREDWKFDRSAPNMNNEREPEHTIVQGDVTNPNLEVHLYGDKVGTRTVIQPYNKDITYVMSLLCTSNWAITLRDKNNDVDLTGLATLTWRTRVSGFHLLRPILKLADGTWLVGDKTVGLSLDWVQSEFNLVDVRWRTLDIENVVEGREAKWVENPNLSRVEEIGFTDLMRGAGHGSGGGSRVDWIQVSGKPVPRAASRTTSSRP